MTENHNNGRSRRNVLKGFAAAAALPALAAPVFAQQRTEIRVAHVNQPTGESHKVVVEVTEKLRTRTNGRVQMRVFPAAQLGTTTEMIEQASQGEPVIAYTDAAYLSTFKVPELAIMGGPFIVGSTEEAERLAFSPLVQGWYDRLAERAKIRVLALNWFDGARHIIGKAAYPKPSDLKGVKIRVPPVPTWRRTFEPMGAIPTTVEAAEAYSALSQGVVDAAESPLVGIRASRWHEVAKFITLTGHFNLFTGWVISDATLKKLSPEDQVAVAEEFRLGGVELTKRAAALIAQVRGEFEKAGVRFTEADVPAYREATKSFYTGFPDWPAGLFEQVRRAAAGA
jgi:TRAP-type C4-dicarboxylate transport system substrate-binding protein